MGLLSVEHPSYSRNLMSVHGDPQMEFCKTRLIMMFGTINKAWRSALQDTMVKCSAHARTDQHFVVVKIRMKLLNQKKLSSTRQYCTNCTYSFKKQSAREDFNIALPNKYSALYKVLDNEEEM